MKIRESITYALEPASNKPTFEGLTCTSRRYTFLYLAFMCILINGLYAFVRLFLGNSWIGSIDPLYSILILSILSFLISCFLYILNLDAIQDQLTASLQGLLRKIRRLDPYAPGQKLVMMDLHCDDELQEIITVLNNKSSQIQNHIDYLEKILGYIQHEFNTPLAIAHLYIERAHSKPETISKQLGGIEIELHHMSSLVESIVGLIKTKTESFKLERLSLGEVIKSVTEKLILLYPEANFIIEDKDPSSILSNTQYIWAICRNICENALKHGSDTVYITLEPNQLIISDNGVGIDDASLEKIWLPFRKKTPRKGLEPGFGLGLSLVKVLIEKLHRKADISTSPQGTTFTFNYKR